MHNYVILIYDTVALVHISADQLPLSPSRDNVGSEWGINVQSAMLTRGSHGGPQNVAPPCRHQGQILATDRRSMCRVQCWRLKPVAVRHKNVLGAHFGVS